MAKSLQITGRIYDATDGVDRKEINLAVTTTGNHFQWLEQSIGTSEEEIAIASDITGGNDPGWCMIVNKDGTNYVQVGTATGAYPIRISAGKFALFELDAGVTSLFVKANTAACKVEIQIRER